LVLLAPRHRADEAHRSRASPAKWRRPFTDPLSAVSRERRQNETARVARRRRRRRPKMRTSCGRGASPRSRWMASLVSHCLAGRSRGVRRWPSASSPRWPTAGQILLTAHIQTRHPALIAAGPPVAAGGQSGERHDNGCFVRLPRPQGHQRCGGLGGWRLAHILPTCRAPHSSDWAPRGAVQDAYGLVQLWLVRSGRRGREFKSPPSDKITAGDSYRFRYRFHVRRGEIVMGARGERDRTATARSSDALRRWLHIPACCGCASGPGCGSGERVLASSTA
jgi:hypothetical protein